MSGKIIDRETMILMLRAALTRAEHRFARQAALAWLAAFPGDLEVELLYAQVLLAEGKTGAAVQAVEQSISKDPLSPDAYRVLALACQGYDPARLANALTSYFVLTGRAHSKIRLEAWGNPLRQAYRAYETKCYKAGERFVQEVMRISPDLQLAAVLHLLIESGSFEGTQEPELSQKGLPVRHLAEIYHERWPECLPVNLVLAETNMELGQEPEAVRLLHICAAQDSTGLTVRRLWGENHPYVSLWPEDLVIPFDQPIPAAVAGELGWNHLAPGEILPPPVPDEATPIPEPDEVEAQPVEIVENDPLETKAVDLAQQSTVEQVFETSPALSTSSKASLPAAGEARVEAASRQSSVRPSPSPASDSVKKVESELEQLAHQLKQPEIGRTDGRFPVYVIFSCKEALIQQYGPQTTEVLQGELNRLQGLVRQRAGWNSMIFYPDDPACTGQYGMLPVISRDPWRLKNALADLDAALGKHGEMIGALLIVGGEAIVPFHRLPNPTDDADSEIFSDSPYATLDANYFVPEWPVGRLPGEAGPDACLLLEQLRRIQREHIKTLRRKTLFGFDLRAAFQELIERFIPRSTANSFGYTAAVWRRSSLAVFRPIGAPHTVLASPPEYSGSFDTKRIAAAGLGYYNLHGLEDSPAWYGQRDPAEGSESIDYPVALSPEDLRRNGHTPRMVFTEACYGAHVSGKKEADSLALKFLSMGTSCVVASTCIAYGSVNTPLIAADLLGNLFWQHLKSGRTAGEAFMQAKVDLVREMNRRQGYLDGEDQKTLISFVLYGDPLAAYDGFRARGKGMARIKDHPMIKVVSDRPEEGPLKVSAQVVAQVKGLVSEYLPGADLAEMHLCRQQPNGEKDRVVSKSRSSGERMVVTVSKQVKVAQLLHRHYIRVTIDETGNPVKLSLSR